MPPYRVALIYMSIWVKKILRFDGRKRACQQNDPMQGGMMVDPMLDSIRSDQRYAEFLVREGAVELTP